MSYKQTYHYIITEETPNDAAAGKPQPQVNYTIFQKKENMSAWKHSPVSTTEIEQNFNIPEDNRKLLKSFNH